MFSHIFKYRFISFLHNKTVLGWTLLFPLILGTLFHFAFSEFDNQEKFKVMNVAIVDEKNESFNQVIEELSDPNSDNYLMKTQKVSLKKAKQLVEDGKVDAALVSGEEITMISTNNGFSQTILKYVIQAYTRVTKVVGDISNVNPQVISEEVIRDISNNKVIIKAKQSGGGSNSPTNQYFYTLIAMTCMFGSFWGVKSTTDLQANLSGQAMRLNVAPTNKLKVLFIDSIISMLFNLFSLLVIFAYCKFGLNIEFDHLPLIFSVSLCGIFMSLGFGLCISSLFKVDENSKSAILSNISMLCVFLAGMMISILPYYIDKYLPVLKYLNPADLITRSFNILNYSSNYSQVYINMIILVGMGIIFILLSYTKLRRTTYASL